MKPTEPGYWWARWISKSEGTADPDDEPAGLPEIVEVFANCIDKDSDEYLRVAVNGVERSQRLENFEWLRPVADKFSHMKTY